MYDSKVVTEPARRAFNAKFDDQVDPDRILPEAERAKRAEAARKAYFARLAHKSAASRKKAREASQAAAEAEAELRALGGDAA